MNERVANTWCNWLVLLRRQLSTTVKKCAVAVPPRKKMDGWTEDAVLTISGLMCRLIRLESTTPRVFSVAFVPTRPTSHPFRTFTQACHLPPARFLPSANAAWRAGRGNWAQFLKEGCFRPFPSPCPLYSNANSNSTLLTLKKECAGLWAQKCQSPKWSNFFFNFTSFPSLPFHCHIVLRL